MVSRRYPISSLSATEDTYAAYDKLGSVSPYSHAVASTKPSLVFYSGNDNNLAFEVGSKVTANETKRDVRDKPAAPKDPKATRG